MDIFPIDMQCVLQNKKVFEIHIYLLCEWNCDLASVKSECCCCILGLFVKVFLKSVTGEQLVYSKHLL